MAFEQEQTSTVRLATVNDLHDIKHLADSNRSTIGFVVRSALSASIEQDWLQVVIQKQKLVGFVHFRHRLDGWTTVYEICVDAAFRRQAIGTQLLKSLQHECFTRQGYGIRLKCPVGSDANAFYSSLGWRNTGQVAGKRRALIVWEWENR
jgi:ribosomal protein S18 acetylase RimI-like enzyme